MRIKTIMQICHIPEIPLCMTYEVANQISENASKLETKSQRKMITGEAKTKDKITMHPNPPNAYASMRQSMADICSKFPNHYIVIPFPILSLISSEAKSHGLMGITARRCKLKTNHVLNHPRPSHPGALALSVPCFGNRPATFLSPWRGGKGS